ncbi:MAG: phenylalanine--tRNA ligase subunit beta, partial [Planctomycetota bacterium]
MLIAVAWLNRYLAPPGLTADEAVAALERMGFPIESREDHADAGAVLDVEITSNRGDGMSHIGLAREVAAATGRRLVRPVIPFDPETGPGSRTEASEVFSLENRAPEACPRFTARVIRGVKVGPSPPWLVEALESIGQRSVNNVVDVSNFVLFEYGQPTHTFDLSTLRGSTIVVRWARDGERLAALDGRSHRLTPDELVVADAERAVSIAGVIGGAETAVTERTTDVLLEAATWSPAVVRRMARRLRITTDAGRRFERLVDARTIDEPAARAAALILEIAGGELLAGVVEAGAPPAPRREISLRPRRADRILGVVIPPAEIVEHLRALEIDARADDAGERIACVAPPHRPDLTREVDLIEEAARVHGYDRVPIGERLEVEVRPLQREERTEREIAQTLAGLGFFETVTFSFVTREEAARFMPPGMRPLCVDEERRRGEPALRPSVVPSLLRVRRVNADAGAADGVRLFESASVFAQIDGGTTIENRNLALYMDAPDAQRGWRQMRGVIEVVARAAGGPAARVEVEPAAPVFPACRADGFAGVRIGGEHAGYMALLTDEALARASVDTPAVVAELNLPLLRSLDPGARRVTPTPAFPAIERDLSVVVDEAVAWSAIESAARGAQPALLEDLRFVGVYRGKQIGAGKKSVTLRMIFRDPERTLRHEEVDPQVAQTLAALER